MNRRERQQAQDNEVLEMVQQHNLAKRSRFIDIWNLELGDYSKFQYRMKRFAIWAHRVDPAICMVPVLLNPNGKYSAWWASHPTDIVMLMNLVRHDNNEISLWTYKSEIAESMQLAGPYAQAALLARRGNSNLVQAIIDRECSSDPVVQRVIELEAAGKTWGP